MNRLTETLMGTLGVCLAVLLIPSMASASDTSLAASPSTNVATNVLASTELSSGAMTATLPLALPIARGRAQPNLAISYNSFAGLREVGMGWGLNLPSIERKNLSGPPQYHDPAHGAALDPNVEDRFVFQGAPLVPVCFIADGGTCANAPNEPMPTWATGGWHYFRLQIDGSFDRFFWSPDHQTWRIQLKDGATMELGIPLVHPIEPEEGIDIQATPRPNPACVVLGNSSRGAALNCTTRLSDTPTFRWNLVRRWDTEGSAELPSNLVVYRWQHIGHLGIGFLTEIFDTPALNAASPLETFAHHTVLGWEPHDYIDVSNAPIWRAASDLRLYTVTITSMPFSGGTNRELLRRYHLEYDHANPQRSYLRTFQLEGRCNAPTSEAQVANAACPRLPATTLSYTSPPYFATSVQLWGVPFPQGTLPPVNGVRIMDVNADALPDIFVSDGTSPTATVFINNANPNGLMDVSNIPLAQSLTSPSGNLKTYIPSNGAHANWNDAAGCVAGDFVGNGRISFLCGANWNVGGQIFSPLKSGATASFDWWPYSDYSPVHQQYDDIDGDGYLDALDTFSGDSMYWSVLGTTLRHPSGRIEPFGLTTPVIDSPIYPSTLDRSKFCKVADMNGDGLVDQVCATNSGEVIYLAGNGYGGFGTGPLSLPMTNSDFRLGIWEDAYFHDLDGDGFADFIFVTLEGITIRTNQGGRGFYGSGQVLSSQLPIWDAALAQFAFNNHLPYPQVEFADMMGVGSDDIVLRSGTLFATISTMSGTQRGLLQTIDNGIGATTQVVYDNTTNLARLHKIANTPWTLKSPQPMQVVTSVTTSNGIAAPVGTTVQVKYDYQDAVYDGWRRRFRGFGKTSVTRVGDDGAPSSLTESTFHIETCQDLSQDCLPLGQDDRALNAIASLPVLTETSDGKGTFLSSTSRHYQIVNLYSGMDGRTARFAYNDQTDATLYDPTPIDGTGTDGAVAQVPWVSVNNEAVVFGSVPVRSKANPVLTRTTMTLDSFGNVVSATDFGRVGKDQARVTDTTMFPPRADWLSLPHVITTHAFANGNGQPQGQDRTQRFEYDPLGNLRDIFGTLSGGVALTRSHETPGKSTAPPPDSASALGVHEVRRAHYDYDDWGNVVGRSGPNNRGERFHQDTQYNQFTVASETLTDSGSLVTTRRYDRGLGAVTFQSSASGETTTIDYDGFGRPERFYAADKDTGIAEGTPALTVDYLFAESGSNISRVHTRVRDGDSSYRDLWGYYDGFGDALASLQAADPSAGDQGQWIASGLPSRSANGSIVRRYEPWFYNGAPEAFLAQPIAAPTTAFASVFYDAFGRAIFNSGIDGNVQMTRAFHALSVDIHDAEDMRSGGAHANTPSHIDFDGHGRVIRTTRVIHPAGGGSEQLATITSYESTGEANMVTQLHAGGPTEGPSRITRWMQYDSFGRVVLNVEPNTSTYIPNPSDAAVVTAQVLRYAYNDNGDLVGTSDSRGCGENFFYDRVGRLKAEDYSPCLASQLDWSEPKLQTGEGTESFYQYGTNESGGPFIVGRLSSVSDRGSSTRLEYDGRGRITNRTRQMVKPGDPAAALSDRFAPWPFTTKTEYDVANRNVVQSSGADVPELLGPSDGLSNLVTSYSARGLVRQIGGSYGVLVDHSIVDADGLPSIVQYGDAANTVAAFGYDARRRLGRYSVTRGNGPWVAGATYNAATMQKRLVDDSFGYDEVDNLTSIYDGRDPAEWNPGFKPFSSRMAYDDMYRLIRVDREYSTDTLEDSQISPFEAEGVNSNAVPRLNLPKRVSWQSFGYDWSGNLTRSDDDSHSLWDRSIGTATMDPGHPNQVASAAGATAQYDASGNLVNLLVVRPLVACATSACSQRFVYDWDEVGQLVRARRWDYAVLPTQNPTYPNVPTGTPAADLRYAYSAGHRVLKSAVDAVTGDQRHSVDVFGSLRLVHARWDITSGDYERSASTETVYLGGLARVVVNPPEVAAPANGQRVLLVLGDQVSSSSTIIDRATGELVERMTYQAYGATDSDYRPARWGSFREDLRFTGKEDDIEVGLTYFGARFYSAPLARWISPDPLTVHKVGADLNPYAYVRGSPMQLNDPSGLCPECGEGAPPPPPPPPPPPGGGGGGGGGGAGRGPCGDPGSGCATGNAATGGSAQCDAACQASQAAWTLYYKKLDAQKQAATAEVGAGGGSSARNWIVGASTFVLGAVQGYAPGGMMTAGVPLPENARTALGRYWQGAGQVAGGIAGIISGSAATGTGAAGGTLGTIFSLGTASEVAIPVGVGLTALGTAQVANGIVAVGTGLATMALSPWSSSGETGTSEDHDHHIFPQEFRAWFKGGDRNIDIDKFLVEVDADAHLDQLHAQNIETSAGPLNFKPGGIWNENWRQFIAANPNATRDEVFTFARTLCAGFGISGCP